MLICFINLRKKELDVKDGNERVKEISKRTKAFKSLGDCQKTIAYHEKDLKISKDIGDQGREGRSYANLVMLTS